jgi:N-acetylmuramoyl-L-alanine amidase
MTATRHIEAHQEPADFAVYLGKMSTKAWIHVHTIGAKGDPSADRIDAYHKRKGWACIGYHFVVRKDGLVEAGRHIKHDPASAKGHNSCVVAVVFTGHGDLEPWTPEQDESGITLLTMICEAASLTATDVRGHRELERVRKTCPGKMVNMESVRLAVAGSLGMHVDDAPYPTPEDFA